MSQAPAADDAALVHRASTGDQRAVTALIARHRASVFRFARHYTGDADEALDITQEAFASAFLALDRYDRQRPFGSWLMRIAVNKCHDWARRRAVRRLFAAALPIDHAVAIASDAKPIDEAVHDSIELARVSKAIARLPSALKQVLILRTIDGISQAETAEILGLSEKAVETRLRRARRRLIERLARTAAPLPDDRNDR